MANQGCRSAACALGRWLGSAAGRGNGEVRPEREAEVEASFNT